MRLCSGVPSWSCLLLTACAAVAPDPAGVSVDALPQVELGDRRRAERDDAVQRAVEAVVQQRYAEAGAAARAALGLAPRAARARAVLAMVDLQEASAQDPVEWRGLRRGEAQLATARALAPADAFVGWMHAVFLAETGHVSAAAAAAEDALARCGSAPAAEKAALLGIAATYRYELGEERAAVPHLRAYTALRPDDATAQFRLGASLLVVAETPQGAPPSYAAARSSAEEAADAFQRCVDLAPGDEDAACAVARALLRAAALTRLQRAGEGDAREAAAAELEQRALAKLRAAAERFEASAEVRFRLGVVAARLGEQQVAEASYRAALERDAAHAGSAMNLAALLAEREQVEEARSLLRRLLDAAPSQTALTPGERRRIEGWLGRRAPPQPAGLR
ncbi:MAG: hypothetical protein ACON4Z_01340 [Planctomycetota bacterium]